MIAVRFWVLVVSLAFASSASAIINSCALVGIASAEGVHPRPGDVVEFTLGLDALNIQAYSGQPQVVMSRATISTSNQIALDVVITTDTTPFQGYQLDTVTSPGTGTAHADGTLGSFPAGDYTIVTTLRVYDPATATSTLVCEDTPHTTTFTVYAGSGIAPVIEFYNAGLDHYFMTQDPNEIHDLDEGVHPGWIRTGQSFLAYQPGQTGDRLARILRFYGLPSAGLDSHFYTDGNPAETFRLLVGPLSQQWQLETYDAFELYMPDSQTETCREGTVPVYRLWNQRADSNHRYTTDRAIKAEMIARGYVAEGSGDDVVFLCALSGG